jgi:hypothetical protein
MEPILVSRLRQLFVHALALVWLCAALVLQAAAGACQYLLSGVPAADPQRLAVLAAWEAEVAAGWQEPEPEQPELVELPLDPALVGSGWDSWSSNPWLDEQQVEELPGAWFC